MSGLESERNSVVASMAAISLLFFADFELLPLLFEVAARIWSDVAAIGALSETDNICINKN